MVFILSYSALQALGAGVIVILVKRITTWIFPESKIPEELRMHQPLRMLQCARKM